MSGIPQTQVDLEKQLQDQLALLVELANLYDTGKTFAAKPIATVVRVLVHDTTKSTSLLTLLNRKGVNFFDTNGPEEQSWGGGKHMGSYHGLVGVATNSTYPPYLDEPPPGFSKSFPFDEYWSRVVFIDGKGNSFTRRDIILALANEDGGAHVDPGLTPKYAQLSRQNSMSLTAAGADGVFKPFEGPELAAARQIAHEMLRTLEPSYPHQKYKSGSGIVFSMGSLRMFDKSETSTPAPKKAPVPIGKVDRRAPCPCGSGRRYKNCCEKKI